MYDTCHQIASSIQHLSVDKKQSYNQRLPALFVEISFIFHLLSSVNCEQILQATSSFPQHLSSVINRLFHSHLFSSPSTRSILLFFEEIKSEISNHLVFSLCFVIDVIEWNILICSLSNKSTIEWNQILLVYSIFRFICFCWCFRSFGMFTTIVYVLRRLYKPISSDLKISCIRRSTLCYLVFQLAFF